MSASSEVPVRVRSDESPRQRLRALINSEGMVQIPAIHDAFSARAAEELGFEAVYLGGGVAVAVGYHAAPDMTMVSTGDILEVARSIIQVIDIPLIIDFEDGGGNPLQVRHAVQLAEAAGIAGLHIEDTDYAYPKHLPPEKLGNIMSFDDNHLISREAAVQRIRAAVEARRDPDLVIMARTDGALESKEEALIRMKLLADAGADVILPIHFPYEEVQLAVKACGRPVMMMPIRVGSHTAGEREQSRRAGVKALLEITQVSYAIYRAVLETLTELKETGGVEVEYSDTLKTVQEIIRYPEWGELAQRYAPEEAGAAVERADRGHASAART